MGRPPGPGGPAASAERGLLGRRSRSGRCPRLCRRTARPRRGADHRRHRVHQERHHLGRSRPTVHRHLRKDRQLPDRRVRRLRHHLRQGPGGPGALPAHNPDLRPRTMPEIRDERGFATKGELAREQLGVGYVVAVPKSQQIKSLAGIWRIDELIGEAPGDAWQRLSCGDGAKGPRIYDWAAAQLPTNLIFDPDPSTHRRSSGVSCVPPPCGRTFDGGISGLAISHSPSGTTNSTHPAPSEAQRAAPHMTRSYRGSHGFTRCHDTIRAAIMCAVKSMVKDGGFYVAGPINRPPHHGLGAGPPPTHVLARGAVPDLRSR